MCKVFIVGATGVRKVDPTDLAVKVRLAHLLKKEAPKADLRPVTKKQSKTAAVMRPKAASVSRQYGGNMVKGAIFVDRSYYDKDDFCDHYSQRCGEHNHRQKVCFKTARRREVVRY